MKPVKTYNTEQKCWEWRNLKSDYHREDGPAREYDDGHKWTTSQKRWTCCYW